MIEFQKAIDVAMENVTLLIPRANNITLEGAMISGDGKSYEINLSYELSDDNTNPSTSEIENNPFYAMAKLMKKRREKKIFIVSSSDGKFLGFKNFKENT